MAGFFRRLLDRAAGRSGANPAAPGLASYSPEEFFAGDEAWIPVRSSNLLSVAFLGPGDKGTLGVRFHKDGVPSGEFWYFGENRNKLEALLAAPSKGKYFHRHIRGPNDRPIYPFRKIW